VVCNRKNTKKAYTREGEAQEPNIREGWLKKDETRKGAVWRSEERREQARGTRKGANELRNKKSNKKPKTGDVQDRGGGGVGCPKNPKV
jgi:hypothetical protein